LWQGAVERISRAGIKEIGLIHRGFSSYGNTEFRNAPMWHLALEMKRRMPGILMVNDPSHICGRRDILQSTAQKAIDLDFDGLMIESHIDPDNGEMKMFLLHHFMQPWINCVNKSITLMMN
jgi:chorismate mutase